MSLSKLVAGNKLVSTCAVSRDDRRVISQLKVITGPAGHGGDRKRSSVRSSLVWQYFGALHKLNANNETIEVDTKRVYCR
jgi:hypothetical protein